MTRPITSGDSIRDAVALVLITGSVAPVAYAWRGLAMLSDESRINVEPGKWAVDQWAHYAWTGVAGGVMLVLGILVGVWSYLHRRRRIRQPSTR